jgi:2-polyprenyl-3-methyl-5-hydroxy-6-metoxy-1,4-benzoquinol methylase/spore coat polysaccharide biosynthesis predicted glycosyltransferase SpsG
MGNIISGDNLNERKASVLLVSTLDTSKGTGHLRRMLHLLEVFGDKAKLYAPDNALVRIAEQLDVTLAENRLCRMPENEGPWRLIVIDNFKTSLEEARFFLNLGRVVAIDEGGEARSYFPYLLDLLPSLPEAGAANESNAGYLDLPERSGGRLFPPKNILITFGGKDDEHLTEVMGQLLDSFGLKGIRWDVVKGPMFKRTFAWPGVHILEAPNVKEILPHYDLVFTHFGLTAYEAASSGAVPILLNPTLYHHKLAKHAGFPTLGVKKVTKSTELKLQDFLNGEGKNNFTLNVRLGHKADLARRLDELAGASGGCPACPQDPSRFGRVIYRDKNKSYAECPVCGLVYQEIFYTPTTVYRESYFFEEYKKQYGKTYLEDFDHIKTLGKRRLKKITQKLRTGGRRLLDIGCAYGAFMQAAKEQNFDVTGLDASTEAINYVKEALGMPAQKSFLPENNPFADETFDVVTLWFVIEHFKNFDAAMRQISKMVKPGGILAFSTPKGDGLTVSMNAELFYRSSPEDHYVIFNKKNAARLLAKYGFKIYAYRTTGVHPERKYPDLQKNSFRHKFLKKLFKLQGKGDTFEVFARKL